MQSEAKWPFELKKQIMDLLNIHTSPQSGNTPSMAASWIYPADLVYLTLPDWPKPSRVAFINRVLNG